MKIIGIGLNKTGTKTLAHYLRQLGFNHQTYSLEAFEQYRRGDIVDLLAEMEAYDSFEDWPWPLFYQAVDNHFSTAKFILTVRKSPEKWYRSLCNMAVRRGPFDSFEKHIYGYAMPQGHREEHIQFYNEHNRQVEDYFRDRPDKLLKICWEEGDHPQKVIDFLGIENAPMLQKNHANRSSNWVYRGDNLILAQLNRLVYQSAVAKRSRKVSSTLRSQYAKYRHGRRQSIS